MEYYSNLKNKMMAFTDKWMELENIMLIHISQSPNKQRPNVFSDKWMLIHSGVGAREEWRNSEQGRREGEEGRLENW